MGPDLRDADFGISWLRYLSAAEVPRESPPHLARLWHTDAFDLTCNWRGLVTRYDKTATIYLAGLHLAAIFIWSAR
ncbi:hypothetical protein [Streptomyces sp. NPDC002346]